MKTHFVLFCLVIAGNSFGQEKFTDSVSDCAKYKSLYYQYLKHGQFGVADAFWKKAYESCSDSNELDYKLFKNGKVIKFQLGRLLEKSDTIGIKSNLDSLLWIYQEGLTYVNEDSWGYEYCSYLIYHKKYDESGLVDSLMGKMFDGGDLPKPSQIEAYFHWKLSKSRTGKSNEPFGESANEALGIYCQLSQVCHKAMEVSEDSSEYWNVDMRMRVALLKHAPKNDMALDQIKQLNKSRSAVKSVLKSQLERDLELLEGCDKMSTDYYSKVSKEMLDAFPNAFGFASFAHVNYRLGNFNVAIEYYEKALTGLDDTALLSIWRYKLSLSYYAAKEYKKAFKYAELVEGEHKAEAMKICGDCIAATANLCGESTIERKANYWLANDYYQRAKSLGLDVSGTEYLKNAPSVQDIFDAGFGVGDKIILSCWGESTVIR